MEKVNRLFEQIRREALKQDQLFQKALHKQDGVQARVHKEVRDALERILD